MKAQSIRYGAWTLQTFKSFCRLLENCHDSKEDATCVAELTDRLDIFAEALWLNRHCIPRIPRPYHAEANDEDPWLTAYPTLPVPAFESLETMIRLYRTVKCVPLVCLACSL